MKERLNLEFTNLLQHYTSSASAIETLYNELIQAYSSKSRHYHNLDHIINMFQHLEEVETHIEDLDVMKLAIWYHDAVYNSTKSDNEEKSAELAKKRLNSIDFNEKRLEIVQKLIISTKKHQIILHENNDNAFLLDIDLSILGSDWKTYCNYSKNVRKEYAIYPNFMYKKGRKKVLSHFLERSHLYFTEYFRGKYEAKARENLNKEFQLL